MKQQKWLLVVLALVMVLALVCIAACEQPQPEPEPIDEEPTQFTVTFDKDGGTGVVAPITVDENSKISAPNGIAKDGYTLDGWYNGETKWNFETDVVTSALTLKAKWIARTDIAYSIEVYIQDQHEGQPLETFSKLPEAQFPQGFQAEYSNGTFGSTWSIESDAEDALELEMLKGFELDTERSILSLTLGLQNNVFKIYYKFVSYTVSFGEGIEAVTVYPSISAKVSAPQVSVFGGEVTSWTYIPQGEETPVAWNFNDDVTSDMELTKVVTPNKYDYSFTKANEAENYVTLEAYGNASMEGNGIKEVASAMDGKALVISKAGQGGVKLVFPGVSLENYAHVYIRVTNKATKALYVNANGTEIYLGSVPAGGTAILDAKFMYQGSALVDSGIETLSAILIKNDFADCNGTIEIDEIAFITAEQAQTFAGKYDFASPWDVDDAKLGKAGQYNNGVWQGKDGHNNGIVAYADASDGYALCLDMMNNSGVIGAAWNSVLTIELPEVLSFTDYSSAKIRIQGVKADGSKVQPQVFYALFGDKYSAIITGTQDGDWYVYDGFELADAQSKGLVGFYSPNHSQLKYLYVDCITLTEREGNCHLVSFNGAIVPVEDGQKAVAPEVALGKMQIWMNGDVAYDFNTPVTSDLTLTASAPVDMYVDADFTTAKAESDATNYITISATSSNMSKAYTLDGSFKHTISAANGSGIVLTLGEGIALEGNQDIVIWLKANNAFNIAVNEGKAKYYSSANSGSVNFLAPISLRTAWKEAGNEGAFPATVNTITLSRDMVGVAFEIDKIEIVTSDLFDTFSVGKDGTNPMPTNHSYAVVNDGEKTVWRIDLSNTTAGNLAFTLATPIDLENNYVFMTAKLIGTCAGGLYFNGNANFKDKLTSEYTDICVNSICTAEQLSKFTTWKGGCTLYIEKFTVVPKSADGLDLATLSVSGFTSGALAIDQDGSSPVVALHVAQTNATAGAHAKITLPEAVDLRNDLLIMRVKVVSLNAAGVYYQGATGASFKDALTVSSEYQDIIVNKYFSEVKSSSDKYIDIWFKEAGQGCELYIESIQVIKDGGFGLIKFSGASCQNASATFDIVKDEKATGGYAIKITVANGTAYSHAYLPFIENVDYADYDIIIRARSETANAGGGPVDASGKNKGWQNVTVGDDYIELTFDGSDTGADKSTTGIMAKYDFGYGANAQNVIYVDSVTKVAKAD